MSRVCQTTNLAQHHLVLHGWSFPDVAIFSKFHRNPFRGFVATVKMKAENTLSIALTDGLYNNLRLHVLSN